MTRRVAAGGGLAKVARERLSRGWGTDREEICCTCLKKPVCLLTCTRTQHTHTQHTHTCTTNPNTKRTSRCTTILYNNNA